MTIVDFHIWHPTLNKDSVDILHRPGPVDKIILYAHQEFDYTKFIHFEFVSDYSFRHNIPFYVVICTSEYVKPLHPVSIRYKNVKIINWGTYYLSETLHRISKDPRWPGRTPESYIYPFISMNCKPSEHRQSMMDLLAKYDLINIGALSWLEWPIGRITDYDYKYWSPQLLRLTEVVPGVNQFMAPAEYNSSFMQLVTESSVSHLVMSEKTCMPLFQKKPFLVLGSPGFYSMLQDYGFSMYDEIFDYAFDQVQDLSERCDAIASQVSMLSRLSTPDLNELYRTVSDKIEYNYNRATQLALDINNIPSLMKEECRGPGNIFRAGDIIDFISHSQPR